MTAPVMAVAQLRASDNGFALQPTTASLEMSFSATEGSTLPASLSLEEPSPLSSYSSTLTGEIRPSHPPTDQDRWIPSWRNVRGDVFSIVRAPFSMDRDQTLQVIGASGLVVGVIAGLDRPAARRIPASSGTNMAAAATTASAPGRWYDQIGPDRFAIGTVGVFAVSGLLTQEKQFTRTSFNLVEALALTKVATGVFKGVAGRSRPYAGSNPWDMDAGKFSSQHVSKSMPSGHTSRAFALASVIAHDYDKWWVQIPAYGVATSVGVQRIRSGNHWLSDVVVGGALGYLIGRAVSDTHPPKDGAISYDPILGSNQLGLRVRF